MVTALWAILIFCVLIFVHEFGHYITAKLSGMTVHEFSIGMGPKIFGFSKKGTMYSIRILPLGGFVKLEGEEQTEDETPALTIYLKRDTNVETQRQSLKRVTDISVDKFYTVVLSNQSKVVLAKFKA